MKIEIPSQHRVLGRYGADNWKDTSRTCICPQCGKTFIATREYSQLRKYCSIACSNRGRAAERRREHDAGRENE